MIYITYVINSTKFVLLDKIHTNILSEPAKCLTYCFFLNYYIRYKLRDIYEFMNSVIYCS